MSPVTIRPATEADLAAINDIYNHYVLTCTCTYQEVPETPAARRQWFSHHNERHPVIVAEDGGKVVGWGALSKFHERSAFQNTAENSIYIHHDYQRRGIGAALLTELITCARAFGYHAIIASIDGEQAGSVALHAKFGFQKVGHLKQVGFKFGRWLDVIYLELLL
jgi:phosphinothricin acetyltransferase